MRFEIIIMSVRIRLQLTGKRDNHHFRIAVMEKRSKRDGKAVVIGFVNNELSPPKIQVDQPKLKFWLSKGAIPSESVRKLLSL